MNFQANFIEWGILATMLAGIVAYFWVNFRKGEDMFEDRRYKTLKDAYDVLDLDNRGLKQKVDMLESRLLELSRTIEALQNIILTLKDVKTGSEVINQIQKTLTGFAPYATSFDQFISADKIIINKLTNIEKLLSKFRKKQKSMI